MKRIALIALLSLAGLGEARGAEYKVSGSGPFIVITQAGGFSSNAVSVNKAAVVSVQMAGKKITLVTAAVELVREVKDGKTRSFDRSVSYTFEADTESEAKALYDAIMTHAGS